MEKKSSDKFWLLRYILYGLLAILILLLVYFTQLDQPQTFQIRLPNPTQSLPRLQTDLPAFPGAEGFGSSTPGGRFGRVIFVTNLNDTLDVNSSNYPGSLRWALNETWSEVPANPYSQRRIIIFKVGGIIPIVDSLILKQPFVTIAGQTAPGDGITIKGDMLVIATHDVIVRGIRVRVGDEGHGSPVCCRDGINISTTDANSDVYNVIIDHCSVSWAIDENMSTWVDPEKLFTVHDITFQWNIISEGLYHSIHVDESAKGNVTDPHSMGAILGQDAANMTVHHNIFAHNEGRNPRISGIVSSEVINNVIYDWGYAAVELSGDKNITHVLNNYFRATSDSTHQEIHLADPPNPATQVYISGNFTYDLRDSENLLESRNELPANFKIAQNFLFTPSTVTMSSAETAYKDVLKSAGVIFPVRDSVDSRVVDEIKSGTGKLIDSQNQVGAWPNYQGGFYPQDMDNDGIPNAWELAHGIDPGFGGDASNSTILAPSGYTWIEEYINSLIPLN